ncbi:MAG: SMC-Scp complex subunit ScpB [Rhizobiaceae bacterium]|nr:SMC-Scp complex subunit ScpB [Rhizobiaceae bacterium]
MFETSASRLLRAETVRMVEALLFASADPVSFDALAERLPAGADLGAAIAQLRQLYAGRGVVLFEHDGAYAFRTAPDLAHLLNRDREAIRKLSRAALEVLSIIAYHQPVTRAEIEDVRGVDTSKGTLDTLLEANWVKMRGRRRTPGRPVTYGTTLEFLNHFGLETLADLPGLDELKAAGLLTARIPDHLRAAPPADPDALADDEDALTDIDLAELGLLTPRVEND